MSKVFVWLSLFLIYQFQKKKITGPYCKYFYKLLKFYEFNLLYIHFGIKM